MSNGESAGNGSLPVWAKVVGMIGLPGFIALYFIGAIPGLGSPLVTELKANQDAMVKHETNEVERTNKLLNAVIAVCLRLPDKPNVPRCGG